MAYKFFDKKTSGSGIKSESIFNKELAEKLHRTIIKNLNKRKLHSPFIYVICGTDLADIQLISKVYKGFLSCVIDTYSKYAWVIPLIDKKGIKITNAFQKILDKSNKVWVDEGSEFYNRSMKSWLKK